MTILTIYVSPLSKKILLAEYGCEPLTVQKGDMLYDQMRTGRKGKRVGERTMKNLSEPVKIAMYDDLAVFIRNRNAALGILINNYHRDLLMRYIDALQEMNIPIRESVRMFYKKYNITEEDYSQEAAWRRFSFFAKTRKQKHRNFGTITLPEASQNLTLPLYQADQEIIEKAEAILAQLEASRRMPKVFGKHLTFYLLYQHGGYTVRQVAAKMGSKRNTVWSGINSIKAWAITDKQVSAAIASITAPAS